MNSPRQICNPLSTDNKLTITQMEVEISLNLSSKRHSNARQHSMIVSKLIKQIKMDP
jgi:hypothetical protein